VQPDLVLVPAAELVAAVVIDASALGYAMPVPRSKKKDRRAAAARVPPATLARRREGAVEPLSYESRALETQAVADALESAREAASEAPAPESSAPTAVGEELGPQLIDLRKKLRQYVTELAAKGEEVTMCKLTLSALTLKNDANV